MRMAAVSGLRLMASKVRTWAWPEHREFGAGWLYNPGGYCGGKDCWYMGTPAWYGSVAVPTATGWPCHVRRASSRRSTCATLTLTRMDRP